MGHDSENVAGLLDRRVPVSPRRRVIIIGGGFAGLAAAVDLAENGLQPLLVERRSFLGGRAYSFTDRTTGDTVDNGQHLMMGCYHHTLNFLEKIGASHKLKFQPDPRVDFLHQSETGTINQASFNCPSLPAPLHLLAGLIKLQTIGWWERVNTLRVGWELRRLNGDGAKLADITVREWLNRLRQSERIQRRFWNVMALATLNEAPEVASADMFARVLDRAFLHTRLDSALVFSKVGLSDLYTEGATDFIQSRGGQVRLSAGVERIEFHHNRAQAIVLRNGERIEAEAIISAVPYFALPDLLPVELLQKNDCFRSISQFKSAPIVSINLWYEQPVTDLPFVGLLDSRIEWVFNKNAIAADGSDPLGMATAGGRSQHLALVVSGAHDTASKPKADLIEMAVGELNRFFPAARGQQPIHNFVVREHNATISHVVGVTKLRPFQRTEFENFFLAGDWTNTGLPATIEGAVWSGQECAREILRIMNRQE